MTRKDDIASLKGGMEGRNTIFDKITIRKKLTTIAPTADTDAATKKYVDDNILPTTQNDVTASRALDTVYRNANTFSIMVTVSTSCSVSQPAGTSLGGTAEVETRCDASNPPTTKVQYQNTYINNLDSLGSGAHGINIERPNTFIVPSQYYYKLVSAFDGNGVQPLIRCWIEYGGTGTAV